MFFDWAIKEFNKIKFINTDPDIVFKMLPGPLKSYFAEHEI